jgi:hypothetical protein
MEAAPQTGRAIASKKISRGFLSGVDRVVGQAPSEEFPVGD